MEKMESQVTFCICVLTFNRGKKALNVAKVLLPELENDWELLFLDNASSNEVDSYQQLAKLADKNHCLRYVRHSYNRGFHRNFLACFEIAKAPYVMIMSDEDFANPHMIREILPLLQQYPSVGIMRGSIHPMDGVGPRNSIEMPDKSFFKGSEALMGFSFSNNYISGTIYNRFLVEKMGLIDLLGNGIERHAIYPHLYLDLLLSSVSDVVTTSKICCYEGHDQPAENNMPSNYAAPYSFGSRIDQFIVLRDGIREALKLVNEEYDVGLFVSLYLRLCEKYFFLISQVNSSMYYKNQIHPGLLQHSMLYICGAAISMYPEIQDFDTKIFAEIQKIHERYELFSQKSS